jgi:hypothetical protein
MFNQAIIRVPDDASFWIKEVVGGERYSINLSSVKDRRHIFAQEVWGEEGEAEERLGELLEELNESE